MKVKQRKIVESTCCKERTKELILITAKISLEGGKKLDLLRVR